MWSHGLHLSVASGPRCARRRRARGRGLRPRWESGFRPWADDGETLERVEVNAEQSLAELRRILGLLRTPDNGAQWRPQPSLGRLDELVSEYRTTGMPVRLEITGTARPLAGGLELSAYRIVEEALTNVLKHTDPTRVAVTLHYGRTHLRVTVEDDGGGGGGGAEGGGGHGILGMRERAAVTGGSLDARRTADGFVVTARLPVSEIGEVEDEA
ncbi:hypothetical protein M4J06_005731 [Streptomyces coelicoflavus]|uniref:sensor histidine kinase n=1 Tax=Streptomyces coelicoflavus TaxID=285562 RepID=UPI00210BE9FE|nr:ATP-binding protein [Streptomyces coelicoflavus]MCQ4201580.1 hypothetical protein [Streptomyces coelicoflavus]